MSWIAHIEGDVRHVWPDNEDHLLDDDGTCKCNPSHKIYDGGLIQIVHNSFDGREIFEQARQLIKTNVN